MKAIRGMKPIRVIGMFSAIVAIAAIGVWMANDEVGHQVYIPGEPVMRRLTAAQYKNVIGDIFGVDIRIGGRFEPDLRVEGLEAIGSSHISVTAAGMEQYDAMARTIASQVVDKTHRQLSVPCTPVNDTDSDNECARTFIVSVGRLLFRRPLTEGQIEMYVKSAGEATYMLHDFYEGLSMSLAAMLTSPNFLFQRQSIEADPNNAESFRLDAYSKASQLSFFLWNSMPDLQLLEVAESGAIHTKRGLELQVRRMIDSPRFENGVRAFFSDNFRFDEFSTLTKDSQLFPKFDGGVAQAAREQTLRTLTYLLIDTAEDYRNIFTSRKTFLTPSLGAIYKVPVVRDGPNGAPDSWKLTEFAESGPIGGILTHISFTALHSPPGRGSPTIRGKAVREIMLCQKIPAPPGDISFDFFLDTNNEQFKTARQRLAKHDEVPECAGCHRLMDPVGLAFENFDGSGAFRLRENGAFIDASGNIDGNEFENAVGLGMAIQNGTAAATCLVDRISAYARGRVPTRGERIWINELETAFTENGYRVPKLMEMIATSDEYYRVAAPKDVVPEDIQASILSVKDRGLH